MANFTKLIKAAGLTSPENELIKFLSGHVTRVDFFLGKVAVPWLLQTDAYDRQIRPPATEEVGDARSALRNLTMGYIASRAIPTGIWVPESALSSRHPQVSNEHHRDALQHIKDVAGSLATIVGITPDEKALLTSAVKARRPMPKNPAVSEARILFEGPVDPEAPYAVFQNFSPGTEPLYSRKLDETARLEESGDMLRLADAIGRGTYTDASLMP